MNLLNLFRKNGAKAIQSVPGKNTALSASIEVDALISASPLAIISLNPKGELTLWNKASERLFGWPASEVIGNIPPIISTDKKDEFFALVNRVMSGEAFSGLELKRLKRDGTIIDVSLSTAPVRNNQGTVCGIMGVYVDETDRKKTEEILHMTEASIEASSLPVFWMDQRGRFIRVNTQSCKALGYSREELLSMDIYSIDPSVTVVTWPEIWKANSVKKLNRFETVHRRKDGSTFPVEITSSHMISNDKEYSFSIAYDLTEIKNAGNALRKAEERYRALVENTPDYIIRVNNDLRYLYVNPAFCQLNNLKSEDILGKILGQLGVATKPFTPLIDAIQKSFQTGRRQEVIIENNGPAGLKIFDWRIIPEFNQHNQVTAVVGTARDVTAQRQLEEQLMQAHKMEAIGQLAGGVAHDFNNLLTSILSYANLLAIQSKPGEMTYEYAHTIEKAAERAAELTSKLLGFARRGKFLTVALDLHDIVREVIALLSRTIEKNINIRQILKAESSIIMGDPGQIQQAILNLAVNSRDAMPDGGTLTFATSVSNFDEHGAQLMHGIAPGQYACITVADTGCGIPKEIQTRIFEPFFTTKEPGKGTGMGLAMVYGIVKNHSGAILVDSTPGQGSEFKLYFPLTNASMPVKTQGEAEKIVHGTGRILIIDDDLSVRNAVSIMLKALGYTAVIAESGAKALDLYKNDFASFNLVIVDLIMPQMNGRECFMALKKINPNIKAILSSGYGLDGKAQEVIDHGMKGFIQKPFRLQELSEIVAKAMK